jgi:hypothetical protein
MDNEKPTEEALNDWLEKVYFGSCCSDPLERPLDDLLQTEKETGHK